MDTYFDLVDLKDDSKRGQIAVTLLEGPAYTWYSVQGNVTGWTRLKAALLGYFKPADYAYKTRQALSKWTQKGGITEYIVGFSECFTQCVLTLMAQKHCFDSWMVCHLSCKLLYVCRGLTAYKMRCKLRSRLAQPLLRLT